MIKSGSRRDSFFSAETAEATAFISLLNIAVRARGRRIKTNSRLIAGVIRQAGGVLHVGSSSDLSRSMKLLARWERKVQRKLDQWPELLGWKNYRTIRVGSMGVLLKKRGIILTVSQLVNNFDR